MNLKQFGGGLSVRFFQVFSPMFMQGCFGTVQKLNDRFCSKLFSSDGGISLVVSIHASLILFMDIQLPV